MKIRQGIVHVHPTWWGATPIYSSSGRWRSTAVARLLTARRRPRERAWVPLVAAAAAGVGVVPHDEAAAASQRRQSSAYAPPCRLSIYPPRWKRLTELIAPDHAHVGPG